MPVLTQSTGLAPLSETNRDRAAHLEMIKSMQITHLGRVVLISKHARFGERIRSLLGFVSDLNRLSEALIEYTPEHSLFP